MSPEAYVHAMKKYAKEEREMQEAEEDERNEQHFVEWLADLTDEQVAEYERDMGKKAGTYLRKKQEYLEHQAQIKTEKDDLFDD